MDEHFLFYVNPEHVTGSQVVFPEDEARHMVRVLRKKQGDQVLVTDGTGKRYQVEMAHVGKKNVTGQIIQSEDMPRPRHMVLAMGVIRQRDRFEYAIEKAVELGVSHFIFMFSEHAGTMEVKRSRVDKTIISAIKQSGRYFKPTWEVKNTFEEMLEATKNMNPAIYIADINGKSPERLLGDTDHRSRVLIVGPEGGLSEREMDLARSHRATPIRLGEARLRAETAVCSILAFAGFS